MILDENYSLVIDQNNVTLVFKEKKTRTNKDTKEEIEYEAGDEYYYPNVSSALKRYLDLVQKSFCAENKDVKDLIEHTENTYKRIEILFKK